MNVISSATCSQRRHSSVVGVNVGSSHRRDDLKRRFGHIAYRAIAAYAMLALKRHGAAHLLRGIVVGTSQRASGVVCRRHGDTVTASHRRAIGGIRRHRIAVASRINTFIAWLASSRIKRRRQRRLVFYNIIFVAAWYASAANKTRDAAQRMNARHHGIVTRANMAASRLCNISHRKCLNNNGTWHAACQRRHKRGGEHNA